MKFAVIALIGAAAATEKAVKALNEACTLGSDECGYEKDKKNICIELDYSGLDDAAKKLITGLGSNTKMTTCQTSASCEGTVMEAWDAAGVAVTCGAKALAGSALTVAAAFMAI